MQAPLIETARLRLRGFRAADLDDQVRMLGCPEVMRHVGGKPLNREETWRKMLSAAGQWEFLGYGYWAVERREDGRFVGQAGLADFKRDISPSIEGIPEAGWIFLPEAQGQGYAQEAASAVLDWGDRHLNAAETVAIIDRDNGRSIRLAERLGFATRQEVAYKDDIVFLLRRARPDTL